MNMKKRCDLVRAMDMLVRACNSEDHIEIWWRIGVADGDITPETTDDDLSYYIEDENFADLMDTFLYIMKKAHDDGGLYFDGIINKPMIEEKE